MAVINTTGTFANNEQVTSDKLNNLIDQAVFVEGARSGTTLEVTAGGQLKVGIITASEMGTNSVEAAAIKNGEVTPAKLSIGGPAWDNFSTTAITNNNVSGTYYINLCTSRSSDGDTVLQFGSQTGGIANAYIRRASGVNGNFEIANSTGNGNIVVTNSGTGSLVLGTAPIPTPSGTAPVYGARAWVNFDGTTTTPTIRSSGNVASVAKTAAGNYLITLTTSIGNTNYAVIATAGTNLNTVNTSAGENAFMYEEGLARTNNSFRVRVKQDDGGTTEDRKFVNVVVFG
jgi:hypothetical protein